MATIILVFPWAVDCVGTHCELLGERLPERTRRVNGPEQGRDEKSGERGSCQSSQKLVKDPSSFRKSQAQPQEVECKLQLRVLTKQILERNGGR